VSTPDPEADLLLDYVAAFREVERPEPDAATKTWRGIEAATASTRRGPFIGIAVAVAVVAVAASLLIAFLLDWQGLRATTTEHEPTQAPFEATPQKREQPIVTPRSHGDARAPDAVPGLVPAPDPDPSVREEPVVETPEPAAKRPPRPRPKPSPGPSTLAEETALLKSIQEALVQGQANLALGKVAAHQERFPNGVFRNEVTVAKAQALCKVGRPEQARAVAAAFIERHPRSHLVTRAKTICRP
jgi:hypothetical protein